MEIMPKGEPLYQKEENQRGGPTWIMHKGLLPDSNQKCNCHQLKMGRGWFTRKCGAWGIFWNEYSQNVQVSQQRESMSHTSSTY